jgi:hypothetical protein
MHGQQAIFLGLSCNRLKGVNSQGLLCGYCWKLLLCLYNFHIKRPELKFSRFCCVVTVENGYCVCIIFILSVQNLNLLIVDFYVVPWFWMCWALPPCHIWTSKIRYLGAETAVYIYYTRIRFCWLQNAWKKSVLSFYSCRRLNPV